MEYVSKEKHIKKYMKEGKAFTKAFEDFQIGTIPRKYTTRR